MHKFMRLPLILLMIFFALLAIAIQAQDNNPDELIPSLVRELNLWRINSHLGPLVYNETLEKMAILQADYLISLPEIPDDIHAGRQGEYARERSQFPEFAWATYGHPQRFAVSEIAAVGSIRSAMGFWTTSDLHTRSALNPSYREIGVAARQVGSDVLFIVVLGGQPNVLPALADPEVGDLYLTSEANEWEGDWIGQVVSYRFLDADEAPINDWADWEPIVDLPELNSDFFYIQYEDAAGNRVTTQVLFQQIWYASQTIAPVVEPTEIPPTATIGQVGLFPTNTPIGQSIFATSTPRPTVTPMPTATMIPPTETPRPQRIIRLIYSDDYFTLLNANLGDSDVFEMIFQNGDNLFTAPRWETHMADLNISALPANHCLQIGGVNTSFNVLPVENCRWIRSFVTIHENQFFWTEGEFTVINDNQVVGTCAANASPCDITLGDE